MSDVVIIEAVRTPIGKRNGGLSTIHSADLLAVVLEEVVSRAGIDPAEVEQLVGGVVSQVGMQSFNITRTAWLTAGMPITAPATTIDAQCGSSQQAVSMMAGLIGNGVIDAGIACGVEDMSQVPMGAAMSGDFGRGVPKSYFDRFEFTSQFEAAERIADHWDISRDELDAFGAASQAKAKRAWEEGRFGTQIVQVDAPDLDEERTPTGTTHRVTRDEGLRETTVEGLGKLKTVARPAEEGGKHTAGTSSQISDGAAAVLMMSAEKAAALGLTARARVVDTCLVGVDPVMMLHGPIAATQRLFDRTGMKMSDIGVTEINEAFASVALSWAREHRPDMDRVNPNGGAIALGHPLGSTGAVLMTKAVHEMERADLQTGLVTMCCGGGMATGSILERV